MDIYHIWCDVKPGTKDMDLIDAATTWFDGLVADGAMRTYRITRRKLGLGAPGLGEFHIMLEFDSLAHLDDAFTRVSERGDPVESFHHAVNSKVVNVSFALYRDFPDSHRKRGEERF